MYYPAIITGALFVGIIISDIFSRKKGNIPEHLVMGLISITLMVWLSMKNAEIVAWGLLMIPIFILAITFIFVMFDVKLATNPTTPATPAPGTATTSTTAGVASNAATTTAATTITPSACTPKQPAATPVPPSGASTTITPSTTC
jgi:hypothetical protein